MCTCMTMSECVRVWPCLNVYVYDHMSHGTPVNTSYHTNKWGKAPVWKKEAYLTDNCTGWRRLIRCLKLQVIYRKRATDYRALLRKMTHEDRHPMTLRHPLSCHTHECVMSHVWMSMFLCVWIYMCMALWVIFPYESSFHMSHLCNRWSSVVEVIIEACYTYEWIMSMNESCHTQEWVTPHIWMRHVTHMNASCRTYERIMSHIWISHVTRWKVSPHELAFESCHTYVWVTSHKRMSHVTHVNKSRLAGEVVMSHW